VQGYSSQDLSAKPKPRHITRQERPIMLNAVFLTEPLNSPSTRFRVLQNIPELERQGISVKVEPIPKALSRRLRIINSLSSYDLVFLQRRLLQWWILWLIRKRSKILIYDFDDAVMFRDSSSRDFISRSRRSRFRNTLRYADVVIPGNDYLKGLALQFIDGDKVKVIPTGINTEIYPERKEEDKSGIVTLGWIGTKPNLMYLRDVIEPINKLHAEVKNFRFKIVCDGFLNGFDCPIEKKWWSEEEEVKDIQSFDIGILPLKEDRWTRGKCALKLLQYLSCGVASLSSVTAVTRAIIRDGINGFLAADPMEWVDKLRALVEDSNRRGKVGREGRRSVIGSYDSKTIAGEYAALFRNSTSKTE